MAYQRAAVLLFLNAASHWGTASADCETTLDADCTDEFGSEAACQQCAEAHRSDLEKAGCTEKEVIQLCKAATPPAPPPGPAPKDSTTKNLVAGTHCLDGSPAAYYYGAQNASSTTWVIYLKGGGACTCGEKSPTCPNNINCIYRSGTDLGSSKKYSDTMQNGGFLSEDPKQNPDFYDAHHVFVPYCSGDTHSGMRNATSPDTWGLYFSGHLNFVAIINDLRAKGMSSAKHILLTGGSAGGKGAFTNLDTLADMMGPSVTVKGAPEAGWFFPGALPSDMPSYTDAPPSNYSCFTAGKHDACLSVGQSAVGELWQAYQSPDCLKAQPKGLEWLCGSVHVAYRFLKTPVFVIENQYDTNQIYIQEFAPQGDGDAQKAYIRMYGEAMRNSTQQVVRNKAKSDGLFSPSCLSHGFPSGIKIRGQEFMPIVGDWFWGHGKLTQYYQMNDDCDSPDGLPCNPIAACHLK